jgi:hypothetical protein
MDSAECAELLHCTKEVVDKLASDGLVPATNYGRGWIFVTSQLLAHVAEECAKNLGRAKTLRPPADGSVTAKPTARAPVPHPPGRRLSITPTLPKRPRGRPRSEVPSFS